MLELRFIKCSQGLVYIYIYIYINPQLKKTVNSQKLSAHSQPSSRSLISPPCSVPRNSTLPCSDPFPFPFPLHPTHSPLRNFLLPSFPHFHHLRFPFHPNLQIPFLPSEFGWHSVHQMLGMWKARSTIVPPGSEEASWDWPQEGNFIVFFSSGLLNFKNWVCGFLFIALNLI